MRVFPGRAAVALGLLFAAATACQRDVGVDQPPQLLFGDVPIQYPLDLWDREVEGQTIVRVLVNPTGGVDSVEVAEPSGYAAFDSAALAGAALLRFEPARRGDRRVRVWALVPVRFDRRPRPDGA